MTFRLFRPKVKTVEFPPSVLYPGDTVEFIYSQKVGDKEVYRDSKKYVAQEHCRIDGKVTRPARDYIKPGDEVVFTFACKELK